MGILRFRAQSPGGLHHILYDRFCSGQQDVVHNTGCFFTAKSAKDAKLLNFLVLLVSWWLSNIILTITDFR